MLGHWIVERTGTAEWSAEPRELVAKQFSNVAVEVSFACGSVREVGGNPESIG